MTNENRLVGIEADQYSYDSEGNLIGQNGIRYVVNPGASLSQVLMRVKPDGTTNYYVYGMGLLYEETDGGTATYHYDHLGSTTALTDDQCQVTDRCEYSPYGMTVHREGTHDSEFWFNGRHGVMTVENGLLHMRARWYNPYLRRFINPDPIGFAGGLNWYAYASGDPVNALDPFGLETVVIISDNTAFGDVFLWNNQVHPDPDTTVYSGVSSTEEMVNILDAHSTYNGKIDTLYVSGHANYDGFGMSFNNEALSLNDLSSSEVYFIQNSLTENPTIISTACFSCRGDDAMEDAQQTANTFNATVWGNEGQVFPGAPTLGGEGVTGFSDALGGRLANLLFSSLDIDFTSSSWIVTYPNSSDSGNVSSGSNSH